MVLNELLRIPKCELTSPVTLWPDPALIIAYDPNHPTLVKATRNACRHHGGKFYQPNASSHPNHLVCASHGWCLDAKSMSYTNPTHGPCQPTLSCQWEGDTLVVAEDLPLPYWEPTQSRHPLVLGEFSVTFMSHACAEIACGQGPNQHRLITDPWLIGPGCSRGWWLAYPVPPDWLERLSRASLIYISHNHPDHLNPHTLSRLATVNPHVPIVVPAFEDDSCIRLVQETGMQNVTAIPFRQWQPLGEHGRFMILEDTAGRHDSGLLVEYKGHRVMNTADSMRLESDRLPPQVDVLLHYFSGGASNYPVCWPEQYSKAEILKRVRHNNATFLQKLVSTCQQTSARLFIPFAGHFKELSPADEWIREVNVKNSVSQAIAAVERQTHGSTQGWTPRPGGTIDVGSLEVLVPGLDLITPTLDTYYMEAYRQPMIEAAEHPVFSTSEGFDRYFQWAGFQVPDMVLQVQETNETFDTVLNEFWIDFAGPQLITERPTRPHRFQKIRVRQDSFRYCLLHGRTWDDLVGGFQARLYREPDCYDFDFWDHFQNHLPHHVKPFEKQTAPR
jgi:CMP-N-acetylneuraminate monooxygenase